MTNYTKDFGSFGDHIWLNAASEGPLPKCASAALKEAIRWKSLPYELTNDKFIRVPKQLKESIGRLLNVSPRDVFLANSASYGLHLLAEGLPWQKGDEIILMQNDFPSDILPWLALEKKGVVIKQVKAGRHILSVDELAEAVNERTKLFCIAHVHTFSGFMADIDAYSQLCRDKGIIFVLNVSQSAGTMPLDFSDEGVDAVVAAGYKWLCGPYGVGYGWMRSSLRDQLDLNRAYWVSLMSEEELASEEALRLKELKTARKLDVFGTANFFNFVPFNASIEYFLEMGIASVWDYNQDLIDVFIEGLPEGYRLISPKERKERSNIVFFSHRDNKKNKEIVEAMKQDHMYPGFWKGNIRIAPHIYNTPEQMKRVTELLNNRA